MSQETTNKTSKRAIIIIGVTLIAVIAIGAGVWAYRSFSGSPSTTTITATPISNQSTTQTSETGTATVRTGTGSPKLTFSLGPGQAQPDNQTSNPVVDGTPLTDAEIAQILARLPELTGEAGDVQDYNLPDALLPPPLTGDTIDEPFPPPPTPIHAAGSCRWPIGSAALLTRRGCWSGALRQRHL